MIKKPKDLNSILPISMCMKIRKEDVLKINYGFGGNLRSDGSLDFTIEIQENAKLGDYKKLAYLWKAILVDHPFSDGNKRTAMFFALNFAEEKGKRIDRDLLLHHAISIAKNNVIDIKQIEWRLKNGIK